MPRRKITEPIANADALPELTPQQQEFVRHLLAGKTASDAYRASFDCADWLPKSVWTKASALYNDVEVQAWLSIARQAGLGTAVLTRDAHQQQLERLREIAVKTGNVGAAVQAELARGKVAGHHVERIQEVPADASDTLNTIAKHQPDLAAQLAAAHGIPWTADEHATKH